MAARRTKLKAAKQATGRGDRRASATASRSRVIAGTTRPASRLPARRGRWRAAVAETRAAAREAAVAQLEADGGTAIGAWLTLARRLFEPRPARIRHAILLTDGQNQHETRRGARRARWRRARAHFQCDCRGVGTDWEVAELRQIASALLGSVDIIAEPARHGRRLPRDHATRAMGKATADVALRLWTPQGSRRDVRQAGRAGDRGPHRPGGPPSTPLTRRLPDRRLGRRGARLPRLHRRAARATSATRCWPGRRQPRRRRRGRQPGADPRRLDRRPGAVDPHQPPRSPTTPARRSWRRRSRTASQARKAGDEETATLKLGRAVQLAARRRQRRNARAARSVSSRSTTRRPERSGSSATSRTSTRCRSTPARPRRCA